MIEPGSTGGAPRIMVLNLYHGGHHPQHLEALSDYWSTHEVPGELHFVLAAPYRQHHPELVSTLTSARATHVHLVDASNLTTNKPRALIASDRRHGRVVRAFAERLRADHVLLMYLDHVQLSLAFGLRFDRPLSLSGILFRPTFHYGRTGLSATARERLTGARKRLTLSAALRNPHIRYVFCLDHLAAKELPRLGTRAQPVSLPEPLRDERAPGRDDSTIAQAEPGRRRLLLLGNLDERKGIDMVLDALSSLSAPEQSSVALLLAGRVVGEGRTALLGRISALRDTSHVQVVFEDRYLDEDEMQPLVRASDLVLLTYIGHVGSSGVLVRAARAGVPVLSTDVGLLGDLVRRHHLGATVDAASATAIRETLARWLADPTSLPFDAAHAQAFSRANTAETFAETILSRLAEPVHDGRA